MPGNISRAYKKMTHNLTFNFILLEALITCCDLSWLRCFPGNRPSGIADDPHGIADHDCISGHVPSDHGSRAHYRAFVYMNTLQYDRSRANENVIVNTYRRSSYPRAPAALLGIKGMGVVIDDQRPRSDQHAVADVDFRNRGDAATAHSHVVSQGYQSVIADNGKNDRLKNTNRIFPEVAVGRESFSYFEAGPQRSAKINPTVQFPVEMPFHPLQDAAQPIAWRPYRTPDESKRLAKPIRE
jgi:hypothetical protein